MLKSCYLLKALNISTQLGLFDYFVGNYKYLASSEHGECWPNTIKEEEIYSAMFDSYVVPVIEAWGKKNNEPWPADAYFNFFCLSDDHESIIMTFEIAERVEITIRRDDFDTDENFVLHPNQISRL